MTKLVEDKMKSTDAKLVPLLARQLLPKREYKLGTGMSNGNSICAYQLMLPYFSQEKASCLRQRTSFIRVHAWSYICNVASRNPILLLSTFCLNY